MSGKKIILACITVLIVTNLVISTNAMMQDKNRSLLLSPQEVRLIEEGIEIVKDEIPTFLRKFYWLEFEANNHGYVLTFFDKQAYPESMRGLGEQSTRYRTIVVKFNTGGEYIETHGVR